jgi:hypothetical protein
MKNILITGKDLVPGGTTDSLFRYKFPAGAVNIEEGDQMALAGYSGYYAWYNISALKNNNKFSYWWFDAANPIRDVPVPPALPANRFDVTIPDGSYTWTTLNTFLQYTFIQNKHYLAGTTDNIYFMELVFNPTIGRMQLTTYPIPSVMPVGFNYPVGATWLLPAAATCPQLDLFVPSKFNSVIGFEYGIYPSAYTNVVWVDVAPNQSLFFPATSILLTCSLTKNYFCIPPTLLFAIPIDPGNYGDSITVNPGQLVWIDMQAGHYASFDIALYDENYNALDLQDTDLTIYLVINKRSDARRNIP